MPEWSTATLDMLENEGVGMMTEAGYLSDSRTRTLNLCACQRWCAT